MRSVTPARTVSQGPPDQLSHTVIAAVSTALGIDPMDLDDPLYDVVDPDALDRVFASGHAIGRIEFTFCDCRVIATADGEVHVDPVRTRGTNHESGAAAAE